MDTNSLLSQLTLEEKIALLSGQDLNNAAGVTRLQIPPVKLLDSTSGIRPTGLHSDIPTAAFPNTICIASTWDVELVHALGEQLAHQAKLKSGQVILGPTLNIHRDPRAGRNFECFSEDPLLTGHLAGAMINGIQKHGVGACPKHFVCNDSETFRHVYDVQESPDGRTLREIYLAAWQHMFRVCDPVAVMMAYNKVDGIYSSENARLIEILRQDWGFKGVVMSDWFGTHSTTGAIKAGLNLEMPFPIYRGPRLAQAVERQEVSETDIDARVLKLLELRDRTKMSQADEPERSEISDEANRMARDLALGGIVLLKNEGNVLPLDILAGLKIAIVGEFATSPAITGGGSASCKPQYVHCPLDIFQDVLPSGSKINHALGVRTRRMIPLADSTKLKSENGELGVDVKYFNDGSPEPILVESQAQPHVFMFGHYKPGLNLPGSHLELTTKLTSATSGQHILAVRCTGKFSLCVEGVEVLSGADADIDAEQSLFNPIKLESRISYTMVEGRSYEIKLFMRCREVLIPGEPTPYAASLCFEEYYSEQAAIAEASAAAEASDLSVIYAGRSDQYESEGFDLEDIRLPRNQASLIKAVSSASKKTVVILHCGNPVDVSEFVDEVDAIIYAHFPGQEGARAVVDILIGKQNPSGRLPTTWFKTLNDVPSFGSFPAEMRADGSAPLKYAEGIAIGYRATNVARRAQWQFGYGLTYTSFIYKVPLVMVDSTGAQVELRCSVEVTNNGARDGKEVVQLYVIPSTTTTVWRPERELKAFKKVALSVGETRKVDLSIDLGVACSYWNEKEKAWKLESGIYHVAIGDHKVPFTVVEEQVSGMHT